MYIYTYNNKVKEVKDKYFKDNYTLNNYLIRKKFDTKIVQKPQNLLKMLNKIAEKNKY